MSRTLSTLVAVGLMLAAGGASEAAQICENLRGDIAAEALLAECGGSQPQGGTATQEGPKRSSLICFSE